MARLLVQFCLSCGALMAYQLGALDVAERELWRQIWETLATGDVLLGDRGFCSLGEFWWLRRRGVDCVSRLNARRTSGMLPVHRLGKDDWLVAWKKGQHRPLWMSAELWAQVPPQLLVRQVTVNVKIKGWRTQQLTVATTLLDPKQWPASVLAELYRRRWQVELFIRDIKTTLGLEVLSCKSPQMVRKELVLHLIAYNLIRALMWEAAAQAGVAAGHLSFKGRWIRCASGRRCCWDVRRRNANACGQGLWRRWGNMSCPIDLAGPNRAPSRRGLRIIRY